MKDLVNFPIKWSLYCPLALCVDHLSRETGYLIVLWRTRCSQPKFKRLKDMTVRKYEQLQSFTYIFDLLLKSSNIMFSNNAMHKIKILHLKRLLLLSVKMILRSHLNTIKPWIKEQGIHCPKDHIWNFDFAFVKCCNKTLSPFQYTWQSWPQWRWAILSSLKEGDDHQGFSVDEFLKKGKT